jgi:hypothetical protein
MTRPRCWQADPVASTQRRLVVAARPLVVLVGLLGTVLAGCDQNAPDPATNPPPSRVAVPTAAPEPGTAVPAPSVARPTNGTVVTTRGAVGPGELTVDNVSDEDALVSLSRGARAAYAIYVRSGESARLAGVDDGDYRIFVTRGGVWDDASHRFTISPDYRRFRESAVFTTKRGKGVRLRITVQADAGGDAQTVPVDPDAYPL